MEDVTPLTDADRDALVEAAGKAMIDTLSHNPGWLMRSAQQAHGSMTLRKLANPSAILSWSARDAAQMRRIAELEAALRGIASWRADCHAHDADMGYQPRPFDGDEWMIVEAKARAALAPRA